MRKPNNMDWKANIIQLSIIQINIIHSKWNIKSTYKDI